MKHNDKDEEVLAAYLKKIHVEKEQIQSIIAETEALEVEQKRRRQLLGSCDANSADAMQKQIFLLENRLNDALVKFNTKVEENKKLRDFIGQKRRERCLYDDIYSKLEQELLRQSQQMRHEIEQGQKTAELRDQAETSLVIAKKELQESKAALDKDCQELCILREKLSEDEGKEKESAPNTTTVSFASTAISTAAEEEEQCNEDLDSYDEKTLDACLDRVMQLGGFENVNTLIERLSSKEERLLSRFQYIAEIEAEVGRVSDDILSATKELEKMKNKGLHREMQHINERELVDKNREKVNEKVRALQNQIGSQDELWEKMRTGIAKVHSKLGLPKPDDILGSDGVSESNVFAYLAEVEKKTTEIFSAINSDYNEDEGTTSPSPSPSPVSCRSRSFALSKATLNFKLPSVKDAPADDGDRPFTFDELKSSLQF